MAAHRSAYVYQARFNLNDLRLIHDDADALAAPVALLPVATPFDTAWRNYLKLLVFEKGFMFRVGASPTYLYVVENKTLPGKEDRSYEGEAVGRKLTLAFFEDTDAGLVRRVDRSTSGLSKQLLNVAEVLQSLGVVALPPDPNRTSAESELLYELAYRDLEVRKYRCTVEPAAGVHLYELGDEGTGMPSCT